MWRSYWTANERVALSHRTTAPPSVPQFLHVPRAWEADARLGCREAGDSCPTGRRRAGQGRGARWGASWRGRGRLWAPPPPPPSPCQGSRGPEASSATRAGSRPLPGSPPAPPPTPPRPRPSPPRPAARPAPSPAMKKLWVKKRFQVRAPGAGGSGRGQEGLRAPEGGRVTAAGPGGGGAGAAPAPPWRRGPRAGHSPGGFPICDLSEQPTSTPHPSPRGRAESPVGLSLRDHPGGPRGLWRGAPNGFLATSFPLASGQPGPWPAPGCPQLPALEPSIFRSS